MSALPRKADILHRDQDVRFVPKADIQLSFDQFVGAAGQGERDGNSKRLGDLEIDNQFDFDGLLDWQKIGRAHV